jgi:AcrR family transcriptional regulator
VSPRRRLTHERRAQIVDAAARTITERGLPDTRVADIARAAGTSPALILYYFGSKDRLLAEALTYAEDRFFVRTAEELAEVRSARERLIRLIERSCDSQGETWADDFRSEALLWLELWARSPRDPEVGRNRRALDRRWRDAIVDIVKDGQATGEFRERDPEEFALVLASLVDGLSVQVVLGDPDVPVERMRDLCLATAARELGFQP